MTSLINSDFAQRVVIRPNDYHRALLGIVAAVCKSCAVEYFCEAKPHKRDLQTVGQTKYTCCCLLSFFYSLF
jgi:hypothetical protein